MKKIILLLVAAFMCASLGYAQAENGSETAKEKTGYNRFTIGYDALFANYKYPAAKKNLTFNGGFYMYNHGFGLTRKLPIYLEIGAAMGVNIGKTDSKIVSDGGEIEFTNFWIKVPVNVVYKLPIANNKFNLWPYTGFNLKFNGILKESYPDDEDDYSWDWFDSKIGNRFQVGWQIGVGFNYRKLYAGVQYGVDFNPMAKGEGFQARTSDLAISLGLIW